MCGITGVFAFTPEGKKYLDKIDDAVKSLHHRGPDGSGVFRHGNVALGHTRLAIIDTSDAASQPFTSTDGRYTIVFNGEIFNYRELRSELEKEGCVFRSQSDTEVLLTLFSREGKDCLNKLNGFFAFAIYDQQDGSLFVARDRFGEKPLYVATTSIRHARHQSSDTRVNWLDGYMGPPPDAIAFASEPKAFYAMGFPVSFNPDELQAYLHLNYLPAQATFNSCISKFYAGGQQTYRAAGFDYLEKPWWYTIHEQLKTGKRPVSYESACAEVRKKLEVSVQRRLISDVPIGAFLSG
ncbi:MAG TPA: asparagine synthetase B, partial [Bacteroidia bacterium]|nr:asparagine synthetase B [Bacteroidia bacterium]